VTVCESGNMTAAAKALGITQSAVSQHIQQLEEFVGTRLLDRSMRPIRPTPAGAVLAERGRRMLTEAMTTTAIARRVGSEVLSELRVGIIASLSRTFLTCFVATVSDHSGQPNLAIWSGLDLEHCEALLDRKLDIVISANPMQEAPNLERHELVREQFVIIVPNGFAKDGTALTPQKLGEALPASTSSSICGARASRRADISSSTRRTPSWRPSRPAGAGPSSIRSTCCSRATTRARSRCCRCTAQACTRTSC
jgi:DNA-binding transcriptional LysR family regulator